jgi:Zn-dependent protease
LTPEQLLMLPLWYAVFLLSVTCHEAAHAWAAYRGGDETAYLGGQVSLNPWPHLRREPFGTILVPLLTFVYAHWMMGWASAPFDPDWEERYPRRAAFMAAAGPLANLGLAVIAFLVLKGGIVAEVWAPPVIEQGGQLIYQYQIDRLVVPVVEGAGALEGLSRLCSIMLSLNLVLFLFNLIPLPPMDGSAIVAGLFEPARRLRDRMRVTPMAGLIGLVIAWYGFRYVFGPLFRPVLLLLWS